jgi:hypothetical protein
MDFEREYPIQKESMISHPFLTLYTIPVTDMCTYVIFYSNPNEYNKIMFKSLKHHDDMHVEILYKYHMFSNGSHLRIVGFCCKCMLQAVICPRSSVSISHYIQIGSSKRRNNVICVI